MKTLLVTTIIAALVPSAIGANELPVQVIEGLFVEEAWAISRPNGLEVFLVINNRNASSVGPIEFDVPGASSTRVLRADGEGFEPLLPAHAELYMQPEGVRLEATLVPAGSIVPVRVSVGTVGVMVDAKLLDAGEDPPDHHDYLHS